MLQLKQKMHVFTGAFIIVAFVFRSFLLHCHAEARSISSIAERDASCLSMTKATILNAPVFTDVKVVNLSHIKTLHEKFVTLFYNNLTGP